MNQISITLNQQEKELVESKLAQFVVPCDSSVILSLFKYKNATITLYRTNVLLIQAKQAQDIYYDIFDRKYEDVDQIKIESKSKELKINQYSIATMGSDEVGTGDFFGGIVVASAYIKPDQIDWLKEIGINDSKKITDEKINILFDQIKDKIEFDVININPIEYNIQFNKYQNSNVIKAVSHNQALWNLSKKVARPYFVIIDEFANQQLYSQYIRFANKTEYSIDIFETKAESKYYAVACASIIARKYFLDQINEISKQLNVKLLLGSSNEKIKQQASDILNNYGIDVLKNLCKNHFITFKEIIGENK